MGFGLPSAIGAKVAAPEKMVVDIDGDASFSMTGMELMTARQFNIGVKALILNNDFQGMVKQWQDLFYDKRYSGTQMRNPDFVKFAEVRLLCFLFSFIIRYDIRLSLLMHILLSLVDGLQGSPCHEGRRLARCDG
jgi:hypothetical protein